MNKMRNPLPLPSRLCLRLRNVPLRLLQGLGTHPPLFSNDLQIRCLQWSLQWFLLRGILSQQTHIINNTTPIPYRRHHIMAHVACQPMQIVIPSSLRILHRNMRILVHTMTLMTRSPHTPRTTGTRKIIRPMFPLPFLSGIGLVDWRKLPRAIPYLSSLLFSLILSIPSPHVFTSPHSWQTFTRGEKNVTLYSSPLSCPQLHLHWFRCHGPIFR